LQDTRNSALDLVSISSKLIGVVWPDAISTGSSEMMTRDVCNIFGEYANHKWIGINMYIYTHTYHPWVLNFESLCRSKIIKTYLRINRDGSRFNLNTTNPRRWDIDHSHRCWCPWKLTKKKTRSPQKRGKNERLVTIKIIQKVRQSTGMRMNWIEAIRTIILYPLIRTGWIWFTMISPSVFI
jgi:hypothetical protein